MVRAEEIGSAGDHTGSSTSPNIILFIADDVGPEEFGCYGHPTIRTPAIDRMAREGTRFSSAFVTTSSCSPSRSCLFTGLYPHETGAENLHDPLPEDKTILPEYLKAAGYWSANAGKLHLGPAGNEKFDTIYKSVNDWPQVFADRPKGQPFFLAMGFTDAHRTFDRGCIPEPYTLEQIVVPPYMPDTPEVREDLAGMYDEITRMDGVIGDVVARCETEGILDNTVMIFLGDNGMPFPRAKTTLYDSGLATPLVIRWPGKMEAGVVAGGLVSSVDLAPTVLDGLGLDVPAAMSGVSILAQWRDPANRAREYIFGERNWHDYGDRARAIRDERYKYIRNLYPELPLRSAADVVRGPAFQTMVRLEKEGTLPEHLRQHFRESRAPEELYDLEQDPHEINNVAGDPAYAAVLERMRAALDNIMGDYPKALDVRRPDLYDPMTGDRL